MVTLKRPVKEDYNRDLLKTVATLYSIHNKLLVQLTDLVKCNETNQHISNTQIASLISAESINSMDNNAQDLIELISFMKEKMNLLLNRTLQQTN